jgi:aspartate racemase
MRLIGLIGGMSWVSSAEYYRILNQETQARFGGQHSAHVLLYSLDFHEIERLQREGRWDEAAVAMGAAAARLQAGGAEVLVLCTNTMHKVVPMFEPALQVPLLHVADAVGRRIARAGLRRIALLGTRFTMEEGFYRDRLSERYGLDIVVPDAAEREQIHRIIYEEPCLGRIVEGSRGVFMAIMRRLAGVGAEGYILGCTEIPLLVDALHTSLPLFDSTRLHAEAALDFALSEPG